MTEAPQRSPERRHRLRPDLLAALGPDGDEPRELVAEGIHDGGPVGRFLHQDLGDLRIAPPEGDDLAAAGGKVPLPLDAVDEVDVGAAPGRGEPDDVVIVRPAFEGHVP